jgi:tripartite motif-containing protein 71
MRRTAAGAPCPGAVGAGGRCPYAGVRALGRRGEGVLRCPEALAFAPDGDLYVADQFSHVVQRFTPRGRFLGQWGSYGSGPGQFGAVGGLAVSASGDVYVLDSSNDRIERFTAGGRLLGQWGGAGTGLGRFDFGRTLGPDTPPGGGIAVGGRYVYVSDTGNDRIERFDLDGAHAVLWGPPGTAAGHFESPRGLTVAGGVVYVADDYNRRIQALTASGRALYSAGTFGRGVGQFADPFDVAVHGNRVYVADDNNNRVVELTRRLRYVREWSGGGPYRLSYVRALAVNGAGRVYVADTADERIVVFDGAGRPLFRWGTPGTSPGQFVAPLDVAADRAGDLLVLETFGSRSPVYLFDAALRYRTEWQRGGGAIIGSHWFGPTAAAVAPDGSAWITDPANDIVRHLSSQGHFLGALGDSGESLSDPEGVAVSASGAVVYVADTGEGRIARFASDGTSLGALGAGELRRPVAVAVGPEGDVYVAQAGEDRVARLSPHGAMLANWGGSGRAPGRFEEPAGIAVDSAGHVFVSDSGNDRVQEFTTAGRLLAAWGVEGARLGEFSGPRGLGVDCHGDVLVADTENNRVQVFQGAAARGSCAAGAAARLGR